MFHFSRHWKFFSPQSHTGGVKDWLTDTWLPVRPPNIHPHSHTQRWRGWSVLPKDTTAWMHDHCSPRWHRNVTFLLLVCVIWWFQGAEFRDLLWASMTDRRCIISLTLVSCAGSTPFFPALFLSVASCFDLRIFYIKYKNHWLWLCGRIWLESKIHHLVKPHQKKFQNDSGYVCSHGVFSLLLKSPSTWRTLDFEICRCILAFWGKNKKM